MGTFAISYPTYRHFCFRKTTGNRNADEHTVVVQSPEIMHRLHSKAESNYNIEQ